MDNLLSIVTFLPALAAVILAIFLRGEDKAAQRNAKWVALLATTITFLISIGIYTQFDPSNPGFQLVEEGGWLMGLKYKMGVDGISVLFVLLTTFVMPLTILASWNVTTRVKEYMIAFLLCRKQYVTFARFIVFLTNIWRLNTMVYSISNQVNQWISQRLYQILIEISFFTP